MPRPFYITFGFQHSGRIGSMFYDKDRVLELFAEDENQARKMAANIFGRQWSMCYREKPDMSLFPGGIIHLPGTRI